jgi:hypothetical protein
VLLAAILGFCWCQKKPDVPRQGKSCGIHHKWFAQAGMPISAILSVRCLGRTITDYQ